MSTVTLTWGQQETVIPDADAFTQYQSQIKDDGGNVVAGPVADPITATSRVFDGLTLLEGRVYTAEVVLMKDDGTLDTNVASATFNGPATAPVPTGLSAVVS